MDDFAIHAEGWSRKEDRRLTSWEPFKRFLALQFSPTISCNDVDSDREHGGGYINHLSMVSKRFPLYSSAKTLLLETSPPSKGEILNASASSPKILRYILCFCLSMLCRLFDTASFLASICAACLVSQVSSILGCLATRFFTCFMRPVNPYVAEMTGVSASMSPREARSNRRAHRRPCAKSLED